MDYNLDHMTTCSLVRQCAMQAAFPMQKTKSAPISDFPAVFMAEPAGGFDFDPSHWVDISDVADEKLRLARYHKSQFDAFLHAFGEGRGADAWIMGTAKKRGDQCGAEYAEAFLPMKTRGFIKGYSILP
jgi:LmbE family N-acetylglucosaminyl deacetylase